MKDDLAAMFTYNRWANQRMIASCRSLTAEQYTQEPVAGWASVRSTVVHIAGATHAWSKRINGESVTALATEAETPTLDDASHLLEVGHDAFDRLLGTLTPDRLAAVWSYQNLQGQTKRLPLWAVLRHVVNHGSYHRGQVASKLKRFAIDPPSTDFVVWAIERTEAQR
jgi:uncharacterized damage-inducible protein DinB